MIKICLAVFLFSLPVQAWDSPTHSFITEESLKSVAKEWKLDEPVVITPFEDFLKKLSREKPEIKIREDFATWLQINPKSKFDILYKAEVIGSTTTPLEILKLYSQRPDDHRDAELSIHRMEQFWFGGTSGANSQAFRHMEKPPFDIRHPVSTSGFPLGTLGEASQRAQIYFDLSLRAYKLGEPYWAWNFLGCALHYLEDLHQPYHTVQLPPSLAWEGIKAYFDWGRKEKKDFLVLLTHIIANAHHYFEGYVAFQHRNAQNVTTQLWIKSLNGTDIIPLPPSIQAMAKQTRNFANRLAEETIQNTWSLTGNNLKKTRPYTLYFSDEPSFPDPVPFLSPNHEERSKAASKISEILLKDFEHQGKIIRTTIRAFIDGTRKGEQHAS